MIAKPMIRWIMEESDNRLYPELRVCGRSDRDRRLREAAKTPLELVVPANEGRSRSALGYRSFVGAIRMPDTESFEPFASSSNFAKTRRPQTRIFVEDFGTVRLHTSTEVWRK
jgi:hypothetical protein